MPFLFPSRKPSDSQESSQIKKNRRPLRRWLFRPRVEPLEDRTAPALDFGDAPDLGAGAGPGDYNTLLTDTGPSHTIVADLFLGANVDAEADGQPSARANGDDIGGSPDDEDSVFDLSALQLTAGTNPNVNLRVTNTTDFAATLYGWIDYNRDGNFDNATAELELDVEPVEISLDYTGTQSVEGTYNGSAGLIKTGSNTLTLSEVSAYIGPTTVAAGTLRVNGSIAASSLVTVANGATLEGKGTVGPISNSGNVSPGNSPGILTINGNYSQDASSTLTIEIGGVTPGTGHDQLDVNGTISLDGTLDVTMFDGFVPTPGQTFTIIDNDGADAVIGTFTGLAEGGTVTGDGRNFTISYVGGDGNDVVLTSIPAALHWQGDIDVNWSTAGNWLEDQTPVDGDILIFDTTTSGFTSFTATNDLVDLSFHDIQIDNSSSNSLTLDGNSITLSNGITADGHFNSISLASITLAADQTFVLDGTTGTTTLLADIDTYGNTLSIGGNKQRSLSGVISGSGGLTILSGNDTLINAANTYTGATQISGIAVLQSAGQLGDTTGATTLIDGTLVLSTGISSAETVTLGGGNSTLRGRVGAVQSGNVILATTDQSSIWFSSGTGAFTISGIISGSGGAQPFRIDTGAGGRTILLSATNTYGSVTSIAGSGAVLIEGSGTLGNTAAGTELGSFSQLIIGDGVTNAESVKFTGANGRLIGQNGSEQAGNVILATTSTANIETDSAGSSFTISGDISNTISGGGHLSVSADSAVFSGNNTFDVAMTVSGSLTAASTNALGAANAGTTVTGTGLLSVAAGVTVPESITVQSGGELVLQNTATVTGILSLAGTLNGRVGSRAAGNITLTSANSNIKMLSAPGTFTLDGKISDGGNGFGVTFLTTGSTAEILLNNSANDYTGETTIDGPGTVSLAQVAQLR